MPSWAKWGLSLLVAVGLIWIGWRVSSVLVTLHVLVCFVLIIVIMLQSGIGRGSRGSVRRRGQPDGVWPARRGDISFSRDDLVRHRIHDDFAHAFGEARPERSRQHRFGPRANAEVRNGSGPADTGAGARPDSDSVQAPAAPSGAGSSTRRQARLLRNSGFCYNFAFGNCLNCGRGGTGRRTSLRGWR